MDLNNHSNPTQTRRAQNTCRFRFKVSYLASYYAGITDNPCRDPQDHHRSLPSNTIIHRDHWQS